MTQWTVQSMFHVTVCLDVPMLAHGCIALCFHVLSISTLITATCSACFKDVPNLFDCSLVILGIVDVAVSSPFDGVKSPVEDFHVCVEHLWAFGHFFVHWRT